MLSTTLGGMMLRYLFFRNHEPKKVIKKTVWLNAKIEVGGTFETVLSTIKKGLGADFKVYHANESEGRIIVKDFLDHKQNFWHTAKNLFLGMHHIYPIYMEKLENGNWQLHTGALYAWTHHPPFPSFINYAKPRFLSYLNKALQPIMD